MKQETPLKLANLTKYYGDQLGIKDVSLTLEPGEVFGFLGPNGAGKSTTIRTVMDFIRPRTGQVQIFDQDNSNHQLKHRIGYLSGEVALFERMSGQQFLEYLTSIGRPTDWDFVDQLKRRFKAEFNRPLGDLSRGNKQKIGLIQAFMHRPDLLILDEPTIGLDPLIQSAFYDLVAEVKENATLFISSHNLSEVQKICDRVGFIRQGELIGLESIQAVKELDVRKFAVTFQNSPEPEQLTASPAISEAKVEGGQAVATVTGDINDFIKHLQQFEILDLDRLDVSLEEVFMHYYRGEND